MSCTSFSNPLSYVEWVGEGGLLNTQCNGPTPPPDNGLGEADEDNSLLFETYSDFFGSNTPNTTKLPLESDCEIIEVSEQTPEGLYYTYSTLTIMNAVDLTKFVCHGSNSIEVSDEQSDDAYIEITYIGKS